ncbi:MAG: ribosome maturation factor RimP [Acidobacteriota bacterium]
MADGTTTGMGRTEIDPRLHEELVAIASDTGCELIHAEFVRNTLRLILDTPAGDGLVSIDDCGTVSRQVSALLDVSDFGSGRYLLEVSSPGLDRELYGPRDYVRFRGQPVRATFTDPSTRRKRTVIGRLDSFDDQGLGRLTIHVTEPEETLVIPLPDLRVVRLEPEI